MESRFEASAKGAVGWFVRLTCLVEAAHDGLVDLAVDGAADADLACTLGAVDLRDVLDLLRRHDSELLPSRTQPPLPFGSSRSTADGLTAVTACLTDALGLVSTKSRSDAGLTTEDLLLLARVAHGLSKVTDRLRLPRP